MKRNKILLKFRINTEYGSTDIILSYDIHINNL